MATVHIQSSRGLGYTQLAVGGTAVTLGAIPAGTRSLIIHVETTAVRMRLDGTAPTAAIGALLPVGIIFELTDYALGALDLVQFISTGAGATVGVQFIES